jgi:Ca-activated chloride channel homolog
MLDRAWLLCVVAVSVAASVAASGACMSVRTREVPAPEIHGDGKSPPCIADPTQRISLTATTGAIHGIVCDKAIGERAAGATVVATSPAFRGEQVTITDEHGAFAFPNLPAGSYTVTVYYSDTTTSSRCVVLPGKPTALAIQVDSSTARGEQIVITGRAPIIDQGSTKTGAVITSQYTNNIPTAGAYASVARPRRDPPSTEAYARIDDNPFQRVDNRPLSTFSIDVDTASYANTRRFLREGTRPPADAVRIEELINYFHYSYPAPAPGAPFSVTTEVGPSPWNPSYKLVRIGLATRPIDDAKVPPRNLVFLLDVSGSMQDENKLPLVLQAMGLLVDNLRPQDKIAIAVYAGAEGVALPSTPGHQKTAIREALASLSAGGSTNGAAGIKLAYRLARTGFLKNGINRVILCTDGDFNVGVTSEGELTRLIEHERDDGVFLTVLGFGMGNLKDSTMEKLADRGNGNYGYVDSLDEARKLLVAQAGATLVTVAKDVKLQVEFNPARVAGYRLIGYENRLLADQDFADDKKDAGDIGAGHTVTALYELVPAGVAVPTGQVAKLKYQTPAATPSSGSQELMTIKLRYKEPTGHTSKLLSHVVVDRAAALESMSVDFRWASAVAGFGMLLRDSPERGSLSWSMVSSLAQRAVGPDVEGYRKEFLSLATTAAGVAAKRP